MQERLKAVCVEVAESPRKIILFIDDIHNLVPNAAQQVGSAGVAAAAALVKQQQQQQWQEQHK
jgi:ATP-dependent Clp protease ATP-binding subunit ClpA